MHTYVPVGGSHMLLYLDVDKYGGIGQLVSVASEMHMSVTRDHTVHWQS